MAHKAERDYNFMRDLAIGTEDILNKTIRELNETKELLAKRNLELLEAQDKLLQIAHGIGIGMKPHKWAKEIIAWANGAEIEYRKKNGYGNLAGEWQTIEDANNSGIDWSLDSFEYRIKPQPKEQQYLYVYKERNHIHLGLAGMDIEYKSSYSLPELIGKIKLEQDE